MSAITSPLFGAPLAAEEEIVLLEPGIHRDINEDHYHKLPYCGSTFIKTFKSRPAKVLMRHKTTDDMLIGQACHAFTLEGEAALHERFVILGEDAPSRPSSRQINAKKPSENTLSAIDWWQEYDLACAGKTILPKTYGDDVPSLRVIQMCDKAIRQHPTASMLLSMGEPELTVIWDDADSGLRCKARIDWMPPAGENGGYTPVDLKKTLTAENDPFRRQICKLHYDIQGGHYTNGLEANGKPCTAFTFISFEATPPWGVLPVYLGGGEEGNLWLRLGQAEAKRLLMLIRECLDMDFWPTFELPYETASIASVMGNPYALFTEMTAPPWHMI
jgi:exodeoxyribonuclease VIII